MNALAALILKAVLPLAVLAALYGVDQRAEHRGYLRAQGEQQVNTVQQLTQSIERSGQLADSLGQLLSNHSTAQTDAKTSIDRLASGLRNGSIRLSVRTEPDPSPAASADRTASRPHETRAELNREDAEALLGLTFDGDAAIRDLNTCIDAYSAVRAIVNSAAP